MDLSASATTSTNVISEYQVVSVDPNLAIPQPSTTKGTRTFSETRTETIHVDRPPREKTPMERYAEMEDELPEVSSGSSEGAKFSSASSSSSSKGSKGGVSNILKSMGPPSAPAWKTPKPSQVTALD